MKQCPVCKTTYTDETLSFCLVDGTALMALSDVQATFVRQRGEDETAVFSRGGDQMRAGIPPGGSPPSHFQAVALPGRSSGSGMKVFLGVAAVAVLVLAIIGGAGAYYYFRPGDKGAGSNPGSADSSAGSDDRKGQEKMGGAPNTGSPGPNAPASSIPSAPTVETSGIKEQVGSDGTYVGPIIGAPGEITLIVKDSNVTGTVKGTYKYVVGSRTYSDPYTGRVSGTLSDAGALNCRLSGNVGGAAFNGTLTGSITNGVASGSWNTKALTAATGTFTATLKIVAP